MADFNVEKLQNIYHITDERHPYNLWGFKQKRKRKFKKKKPQKKRGKIDIYV